MFLINSNSFLLVVKLALNKIIDLTALTPLDETELSWMTLSTELLYRLIE